MKQSVAAGYGLIGVLAVTGAAITLHATEAGAGASPDSVVYIGAARNLLAGRGLTEAFGSANGMPLTRYPPLYPALLAAIGGPSSSTLQAVRWLNALLFASVIILTGVILMRALKGSPWLPAIGSAAVLTSLALFSAHTMVWSEPVFLSLCLLALFLIAEATERPGWGMLTLAAIAAGLAQLTRYAALPVIGAGVLSVLLFDHESFKRRFGRAVVYGVLSIAPALAWSVRNLGAAESATGRALHLHPVSKTQAWEAFYTMTGWLHVPPGAPRYVHFGFWLGLGACTVVALTLLRRIPGSQSAVSPMPAFFKVLAVFIVVYFAFLVMSLTFVDASTPLDDRILGPIFLAGLCLALYLVWSVAGRIDAPTAMQVAFWTLVVLFLGIGAWRVVQWSSNGHQQGLGFSGYTWQRSETLRRAAELPNEIQIYSNAPEAIYLYTQRPALPFPKRVRAATQRVNEEYDAEIAGIRHGLSARRTVVVFFDALRLRASETELREELGLCPLVRAGDGTIYTGAAEGSRQCDP